MFTMCDEKKDNFDTIFKNNIMSPFKEAIAYELLWTKQGSSFKTLDSLFRNNNLLPSQVLLDECGLYPPEKQDEVESYVKSKLSNFSVIIKGNFQYPKRLLDAKYPLELFYYKGDIDLLDSPCISIVGTRKCSPEGKERTIKLVKLLCENGYTIVSGLAEGVDTHALTTATNLNHNVIAVIGTPIDEYYPKNNKKLQDIIAKDHLLISQVPFFRYKDQPFSSKKIYFPERNATMAALSKATVIVEASDSSGTLTQARACIEQGRKLFILNSCFENRSLKWPEKYLEKGAIRVKKIENIIDSLNG